MRTTVDLPDPVFRELKALAARRGTSLKEIVRLAVEEEIRKAERPRGRSLRFPIRGWTRFTRKAWSFAGLPKWVSFGF
jgi:hypothetical protein